MERKRREHRPDEADHILATLKKEQLKDKGRKPPTEKELRKFKLEETFHHFDRDSSGFIDKQELQLFMKRFIYQGLELSEDELLAALEVVDTNKDGKISPEEFVNFMTTLTANMSTADFNKATNDLMDEVL